MAVSSLPEAAVAVKFGVSATPVSDTSIEETLVAVSLPSVEVAVTCKVKSVFHSIHYL